MEFLSKEFDPKAGVYPVNLIVQSPKATDSNYDAAKAGNFIRAELPFNPTTDFHEYRFDFVPGEVHFYADGKVLAKIQGAAIPSNSGHLILQHWSNGNNVWSGGPPAKDTSVSVKYVKAYFNSTDTGHQHASNVRCAQAKDKKSSVCEIPDIAADKSAEDFFFGKLRLNQTLSRARFNFTNSSLDMNARTRTKSVEEEKEEKKKKEEEGSAAVWGATQAGLFAVWTVVFSMMVFVL